jgi:uncharacterized transporter YbjL
MGDESNLIYFTLFAIMIVIAVSHSMIHTFVFTEIPNNLTIGSISGNAITDNPLLISLKSKYSNLSLISKYTLAAEWLLILLITIIVIIKAETVFKKNKLKVNETTVIKKNGQKTDIDIYYDTLKEKKSFRIKEAAKLFGVDNNVAKKWSEILEEGKLAEINYPLFGGATICIKGYKEKKDEKEKQKNKNKEKTNKKKIK